jgi:basic amino acid/polyamine antiporter, APA family
VPPTSPDASPPGLQRRLGLADAVLLGVGSMLGAGIFAVPAPAARAAGTGLLVGLVVAAVVAYANAMSTAQLAAVMPQAGGAYRYGRERLGPWWGYVAGWAFVVGKTASCAAMAATFAAYAAPGVQRPVAVAAVVALVAVNERGIARTARTTRALVAVTSVVLVVVVAVGAGAVLGGGAAAADPAADPGRGAASATVPGVLESAGLLFFAMAGYARIATLGGEVRDPARVIPRAIATALAAVLVAYAAVAAVALGVLGAGRLAESTAPLVDVLVVAGRPEWGWLVRAGAAAACLGALLGLLAGVSRTAWAMASDGELPGRLGTLHPRHRVPHVAERVVGAGVVALVLVADVGALIGVSSFGVLLYYAVANVAALTQTGAERRRPRALQVVGLVGCVTLAVSLPGTAVLVGAGAVAAGVVGRAVARRVQGR